jgi:hypothetical protein
MVCPSCGKEVTETAGLCPFCGGIVPHATPSEPHQAATVDGSEAPFEQPLRMSRTATVSLILGVLAFATLPIAIGLGYFGVFSGTSFVSVVATGISLGLLALVSGHRANVSIKRSQGRISGGHRAIGGFVWGSVGLGIWSLAAILLVLSLFLPRYEGDVNYGVGALRTIDEAATAYACSYGHGYPPTVAAMGPAKTRWLQGAPAPNDKAAGFISEELTSGLKWGYRITYTAGPIDSSGKIQTFTAHADPVGGGTGQYDDYYFTDQTGVIRIQSRKKADAKSGPIFDGGDLRSVDCSDAYNFRGLARPFPVPKSGEPSK